MIRLLPVALSLILAVPGSALDPEVREVGSAKLVVLADEGAERVHGEFALFAGSLHEPTDRKGVSVVTARAISADAASWLAERGGSLATHIPFTARMKGKPKRAL